MKFKVGDCFKFIDDEDYLIGVITGIGDSKFGSRYLISIVYTTVDYWKEFDYFEFDSEMDRKSEKISRDEAMVEAL